MAVLLIGQPKISTAPLKACLNAATTLITGSRNFDHISPHLKALNWLPCEARTQLKTGFYYTQSAPSQYIEVPSTET